MKQLSSEDPKRQERWEHKGREYSIVNLVMAPLEQDGSRASDYEGSRFEERMAALHGAYRYELAELTQDGDVEVLGRFTSFEDACDAIESGMIHE